MTSRTAASPNRGPGSLQVTAVECSLEARGRVREEEDRRDRAPVAILAALAVGIVVVTLLLRSETPREDVPAETASTSVHDGDEEGPPPPTEEDRGSGPENWPRLRDGLDLLEWRDFGRAARFFEEQVKSGDALPPDERAMARYFLADSYYYGGRLSDAARAYEAFLAAYPDHEIADNARAALEYIQDADRWKRELATP